MISTLKGNIALLDFDLIVDFFCVERNVLCSGIFHRVIHRFLRNSEDIHSWDTVNEKISLSDRFGITLTFAPPNQEEYLRIVESMARKRNICLPPAELRAEAIKWETAHSGTLHHG